MASTLIMLRMPQGDEDDDELTNLAEYNNGTDPTDGDTDDDKVGDWAEVRFGLTPTTSNSYARLPFIENFETNTVNSGNLNGQNGWSASPTNNVVVQTQVVYAGSQALELQEERDVSATHFIGTHGETNVWADFYMKPVRRAVSEDAVVSSNVAVALYVNTNGQIVIYDGSLSSNNWVTLTNHAAIATGSWCRIAVKHMYATQKWDLYLNTTNIKSTIGFANTVPEFSRAHFMGSELLDSYIDDVHISVTGPLTDDDEDGLPDWWELFHFGDLDEVGAGDPDSDGVSNADEYANGTNPNSAANGDGDSLPDDWEIHYFGDLDEINTGDADSDGLNHLGEFNNETDPTDSDSDDDGFNDGTEVSNRTDPNNPDTTPPTVTIEHPADGAEIIWIP